MLGSAATPGTSPVCSPNINSSYNTERCFLAGQENGDLGTTEPQGDLPID